MRKPDHTYHEIGSIAGRLDQMTNGEKYWKVYFNGKKHYVHHIVYMLHYGEIQDGYVINHKDCNPENNLIENLEACTKAQNNRRTKARRGVVRKNNKTGYNMIMEDVKTITHSGKTYTYKYAKVQWYDDTGKYRNKLFSIDKLGHDAAWASAKEFHRNLMDSEHFHKD